MKRRQKGLVRRSGQLAAALLAPLLAVACSSTPAGGPALAVSDETVNAALSVAIAPSPVGLPPGNWNSRQFDSPDLHAVFILEDPRIPFGDIGNSPDSMLYRQAAVVCGDLDTKPVVAALTDLLSQFDYTATDTGLLVRESVQVFCRDRLPLLQQAAVERGVTAAGETGSASASATATAVSSTPLPTAASSALAPVNAGQAALQQALQSGIAVDPNPYEGAHPNVYFQMPSANIGCYEWIDGGGECTIASYDFAGPECPMGRRVTIDANGAVADAGCASSPLLGDTTKVLGYGTRITNGTVTCSSSSEHLACGVLQTGTGFYLSRKALTLVR